MYSNHNARMSVDGLSPSASPRESRHHEFPFHRQSSMTSQRSGRRGSTASSIHSVGGQLDSSGNWQGIDEVGQNAISTLLQPPIVRTGMQAHTAAPASSTHKPPTAKDIPPVTLTNITRVDASEFKQYLSQVGALYEQLRRVKEEDDDMSSQIFRRGNKPDPYGEATEEGHLRPGNKPAPKRKGSTASLNSVASIESPSKPRRSSSNFGRRGMAQGPPPLNTIPNVYFDEDFHLENPRTFDVVSERSEVVRPPPGSASEKQAANGNANAPRKALATNAILQEKLSWYMDTVEMHLINSISTASTTFFTALGSLRELHAEAAGSVERIKALRKELEGLDEEIAVNGLDVVQKRRRHENLQQLNNAVLQLKQIVEMVASCESAVDAGEIDKALDGIDSLEQLIAGQKLPTPGSTMTPGPSGPLQDLRGATALQGVNGDISTLRFRIGKAYESRFLQVLLGDLRQHVEKLFVPKTPGKGSQESARDILLRWSNSAIRSRGGHSRQKSTFPTYLSDTDKLRSDLVPILLGLHRAKHINIAIASYREVVLREIKTVIRQPLPSSSDEDNESMMSASTMNSKKATQQQKSSTLARNLRALDPSDAEEMFTKIYVSVTETLRRLTTQVKVLFDVAGSLGQEPDPGSGARTPTSIKSPPLNSLNRDIQEDIHLTMDMANLLGQAVDVSHDKIVKLLRVRAEQSAQLPLIWFLRYFTLNLYFANECETISARGGTTLKQVVNSQIKGFIQQHGDEEKQKLAQAMESDQWAAKDFDEKNTALLTAVLDSSTKDAPAWSVGSQIWEVYSDIIPETNGRPRAESNGTSREKTRSAVIEGENFILPQSAILCLEGMSEFLHLTAGIPSVAADISASLVSYLQLFNSRCTQLILGAGATRSAGLKNITTRHLALAAQALAFISTLIPHIREFVRRHAGSGPNVNSANLASLMGEFDKVRRLFQEHQNNIYDKLVEIMSGRAAAHAKTMKGLNWEAPMQGGVDMFMETLVKETITLHRVLSKHLPEGTVNFIMTPVFDSYKAQLGKTLRELEPKSEGSVHRMRANVIYLDSRLSKIDGFNETGKDLLKVLDEKTVEVKPAVPEKDTSKKTEEKPDKKEEEKVKNAEALVNAQKDTKEDKKEKEKKENKEEKEVKEVKEEKKASISEGDAKKSEDTSEKEAPKAEQEKAEEPQKQGPSE